MIECFKKIFSKVLFVVLCSVTSMSICAQESLSLSNGKINILWEKHEGKWVMTLFEGKTPEGYKMFGRPSGKYNLIYDNVKPTIKPLAIVENGDTLDFPEQTFRYVKPDFLRAISAVPMNRAGRYSTFFPDRGDGRKEEQLCLSIRQNMESIRQNGSLMTNIILISMSKYH